MQTRKLPVPLTDEEKRDAGQRLANLLGEYNELLEAHKDVKATLKEEEGRLDGEIQLIAAKLREGKEEREIEVEEIFDHESLKVVIREADTGRMILTRDMTEQEKVQSRLPLQAGARCLK